MTEKTVTKTTFRSLMEREWDHLGWDREGEGMHPEIYADLAAMCDALEEQKHDAAHPGSARLLVKFLARVVDGIPFGPLSGDDAEWMSIKGHDDYVFQNVRCPRIFKDADGRAWDIQGVIVDFGNAQFQAQPKEIAFPYIPATEVVSR